MPQNLPKRKRSQIVALGGILSALALVILLAGGVIPVGTFAAPIFAGICLLPVAIDIGVKWALVCYLAVSILSFFLVPDLELVLFFIVLCGWYPFLQPYLFKFKSKIISTVLKLLIFNGAVAIVYSLMLFLFTSPELQAQLSASPWWYWAGLLLLGNLTFILYDRLLDKVRILYFCRVRKHILR